MRQAAAWLGSKRPFDQWACPVAGQSCQAAHLHPSWACWTCVTATHPNFPSVLCCKATASNEHTLLQLLRHYCTSTILASPPWPAHQAAQPRQPHHDHQAPAAPLPLLRGKRTKLLSMLLLGDASQTAHVHSEGSVWRCNILVTAACHDWPATGCAYDLILHDKRLLDFAMRLPGPSLQCILPPSGYFMSL